MECCLKKDTLLVRLAAGDEITASLKEAVQEFSITAGKVSGIGACNEVVIGNFDPVTRIYDKQKFVGRFEILDLSGNVSTLNDEPYLHLHISLGNEKMQVIGGHLNLGRISATAEIFITIIDHNIQRFQDEKTGLNLWDLNAE